MKFPNKKKNNSKLQFTKVNYILFFDYLLWKNNGTMYKTMVLWNKLWYYTKNSGTLIYFGKAMVLWNFNFAMEKTMVLWTKLWYYGKKTMVL